jgi:hypothetical protein
MVDVFLSVYECGTLRPVKVILRRGKAENNGGDELTWSMLYTCMEMSQQNSPYNYYIPIKMCSKRNIPNKKIEY